MLWAGETDKRRNHRAEVHCKVSCSSATAGSATDHTISHTKDISEGGMAFTCDRQFTPMTSCALRVELPVSRKPVTITGRVIESKEAAPQYAYITRISFCDMNEQKRRAIQQTVAYYSRRNRLRF